MLFLNRPCLVSRLAIILSIDAKHNNPISVTAADETALTGCEPLQVASVVFRTILVRSGLGSYPQAGEPPASHCNSCFQLFSTAPADFLIAVGGRGDALTEHLK